MVDNWNVIPTVSVAGIEFGIDRTIVRKLLGKPLDSFRKALSSFNTTDVYPSFHVYYSAKDKMEAIEFFGNDIQLNINNQLVFPGKLSTIRMILPDIEESCGSFVSRASSVGVCTEEDTIVSILVACRDYYK